jgi:hypothetical protein
MRLKYGKVAALVTLVLAMAATAGAQQSGSVDQPRRLSGPRFGVTFLSDGVVDELREDKSIDVGAVVTQFGWQFEKRFSDRDNRFTPVTEWVLLVGGLEQGVFLPSVSWIVGLRSRNGAEFGVGPNLTPVGAALAFVGGITFRSGSLNFPVNLAVVPSGVTYTKTSATPPFVTEVERRAVRVSLLVGFNLRR